MITRYVSAMIVRELGTMRDELLAYDVEADIWRTPPGISNPTGTLALHVAGNLRHFIGAKLGATGYVRDRDAEFSARDVPRATIVDRLDVAAREVAMTLEALPSSRLEARMDLGFPGGQHPMVGDFLVHLVAHLAFHVGQAGYHRRLVTGDDRSTNGVSISAMHSLGDGAGS